MTPEQETVLILKVNEIHQRQGEVVMPKLDKLEKTVNGNGKIGLCDEVAELKTCQAVLDAKFKGSWKSLVMLGAVIAFFTPIFMWLIDKIK